MMPDRLLDSQSPICLRSLLILAGQGAIRLAHYDDVPFPIYRHPRSSIPTGGAELAGPQLGSRRAELPHKGIIEASPGLRSEEHTSELQSRLHLVCRLLLEK